MMETNNTFLNEKAAEYKIAEVVNQTEKNVEYFTNISMNIVNSCTQDLDELVTKIRESTSDNISDEALEQYILELSNMLYFVGTKLELMGVKDDLSKIASKQVYNNSYLNAPTDDKGKKPTVAELTAIAEDDSRYETIMNNIYSRAYRLIKYKVDAAYELLASLRKVVSKRMQESQLSMQRNNGSVVFSSEEYVNG